MNSFLLLFCFLAVFSVKADEINWTQGDTTREVVFLVGHYADWRQTKYIAEHPERYKEVTSAPFIGEHPTPEAVDGYFLTVGILHSLVSVVLPNEYRKWWQYITIGEKYIAVTHNFSIGITVPFK